MYKTINQILYYHKPSLVISLVKSIFKLCHILSNIHIAADLVVCHDYITIVINPLKIVGNLLIYRHLVEERSTNTFDV